MNSGKNKDNRKVFKKIKKIFVERKKFILTLGLVVILLILVVGVSYATFNYSFLGGQSSITTGTLELKLLESNDNVIDVKNMFPLEDSKGIKQKDTFDFAVVTKANYEVSIGYDLKIEKLIVDTGYTSLDDSDIKIYLTNYSNNKLISPIKVSDLIDYTFYTKVNEHSKTNEKITNKYKLRVWVDEGVDASDWNENTKLQYKFKIGVSGGEKQLVGLAKQIADQAVMDNVASTYVSSQTGINFTMASSDTNGNGIYQRAGSENYGKYPVYYYRGDVGNNSLIFNDMCWKIVRTTSNGGIKLLYAGGVSGEGSCDYSSIGLSEFNNQSQVSNTVSALGNIEPSTLEQKKNKKVQQKELRIEDSTLSDISLTRVNSSPADVGYMYGKRYEEYSVDLSENTDEIVYGNDVTYQNGKYTLTNTITSTSYSADKDSIEENHHYTCLSSSNNCSSVYYIYKSGLYLLKLDDGNNIDEALEEMLTGSTNAKNSTIKTVIDNWYKTNMTNVTGMLEDAVWCNDRRIYEKGGFDKDTNVSTLLSFNFHNELYNSTGPSMKCATKNDSFTVSEENGNGKLAYPVGLLTGEEALLAGVETDDFSIHSYLTGFFDSHFLSPSLYEDKAAVISTLRYPRYGSILFEMDVSYYSNVYPSITLKPDIVVSKGDGTSSNPYIVLSN